jgi:hypothetical protein
MNLYQSQDHFFVIIPLSDSLDPHPEIFRWGSIDPGNQQNWHLNKCRFWRQNARIRLKD